MYAVTITLKSAGDDTLHTRKYVRDESTKFEASGLNDDNFVSWALGHLLRTVASTFPEGDISNEAFSIESIEEHIDLIHEQDEEKWGSEDREVEPLHQPLYVTYEDFTQRQCSICGQEHS